jgi:hypothetical protein
VAQRFIHGLGPGHGGSARPLPVETNPGLDLALVMLIEPATQFLAGEKVWCCHAA